MHKQPMIQKGDKALVYYINVAHQAIAELKTARQYIENALNADEKNHNAMGTESFNTLIDAIGSITRTLDEIDE